MHIWLKVFPCSGKVKVNWSPLRERTPEFFLPANDQGQLLSVVTAVKLLPETEKAAFSPQRPGTDWEIESSVIM